MKKVTSILLIDYNLQISLEGHEISTISPWEAVNQFIISGEDVSNVIAAVTGAVRPIEIPIQRRTGKATHRDLSNEDIKIGREIIDYEVCDGYKIEKLEAEVVSAHLVNITIHYHSEKEDDFMTELTYSGRFLIEYAMTER